MDILHALKSHLKFSLVVDVINREHIALVHVVILLQRQHVVLPQELTHERRLLTLLEVERLEYLVKDVEVALDAVLENYS